MKIFRSVLDEFATQLNSHEACAVESAIQQSNWRRFRIFMAITLVIELLLVGFVDIPSIRGGSLWGSGEASWIPLSYLASHLVLLTIAVISILATPSALRVLSQVAAGYPSPEKEGKLLRRKEALLYWGAGMSITVLGLVAGLDQMRSGDTSAFTYNVIVVAFLIMIRPPLGLILITPAFVMLTCGVLLFQRDQAVMVGTLINSGIFYIAMALITAFLYNNQYRQIAKSSLLEQANKNLDYLALHDQLTGLLNRRAFDLLFEREVAKSQRSGTSLFVALADIDHFKQVNDRFGHGTGDMVLCKIATILNSGLRTGDAVARWGGEEFLLLFVAADGLAVQEILERLREAVAATTVESGGAQVRVTISFGYAPVTADKAALTTACNLADAHLYEAKNRGRNLVVG